MIVPAKVLLVIFGLCHGDAACVEKVKDLYPQTKGEAVLAYDSLFGPDTCKAHE